MRAGRIKGLIMRVLVIEDDPDLGAWLRATLTQALGPCDLVTSLEDARAAIAVAAFDLVVIDRQLPDGEGMSLIGELRALRPQPGTILLTALDDPEEIASALDGGADDYVGKPFEPAELIARMRAVLRRLSAARDTGIRVGNLRFDSVQRSVHRDDMPIVLPRRELALLELLARRAGRVVMREALEGAVYCFDDDIQSNALDSHVSRLRRRLREADCDVVIRAVRGVGYMLSAP